MGYGENQQVENSLRFTIRAENLKVRAQNGSLRGENDRFRSTNETVQAENKVLLRDNLELRAREDEMKALVNVQMELLTPSSGKKDEEEIAESSVEAEEEV